MNKLQDIKAKGRFRSSWIIFRILRVIYRILRPKVIVEIHYLVAGYIGHLAVCRTDYITARYRLRSLQD